MLWFWQMEGARWQLDGGSFDVAKKAYERLAASKEQRTSETQKRYQREHSAEVQNQLFQRRRLELECEERVQQEREQEERDRVPRARRDTAHARESVAVQARERAERRHEPNPRFGMLRAFREVEQRLWPSKRHALSFSPLPAGLCNGDMAAQIATFIGESVPAWARWWPVAKWWREAERLAEAQGWDGSWCGRPMPPPSLPPSMKEHWAPHHAYEHRRGNLAMLFIETCLPPSRLPAPEPEPIVPPELESAEMLTREQIDLLYASERMRERNAVLQDYVHFYQQCFGFGWRTALVSWPPELAADAHSWAPSVLQQMWQGERSPLPLVNGRWTCDSGVGVWLQTERIYYGDVPADLAAIAHHYQGRDSYRGPQARRLSKYFVGTVESYGKYGDYFFPQVRNVADCWQRRGAFQVRVRLSLDVRLLTRGSHCRMRLKSAYATTYGPACCDCYGVGTPAAALPVPSVAVPPPLPPELVEEQEQQAHRAMVARDQRTRSLDSCTHCLRSVVCSKERRHPGRCDNKRQTSADPFEERWGDAGFLGL